MQIFNIKLKKIFYRDLFPEITKLEKQKIVFTPNPEILLNSKKDKEFENILKKADFLTIDGIGIYIALQILDNSLPKIINFLLFPYYIFNLFFRRRYLYKKYWDRICGSDLTLDLLDFSEVKNIKITVIDPFFPKDKAKCESQRSFKKNLSKKYPKLDFDFFIYNDEKKDEIIEKIKNSNSKILFSTLWMKKQEKSVIEIMEKCKNIKLGLGIWSSFDYIIWFQKRAPKFFRSLWLEWFYRIFTWPQKLKRLKRIWKALIVFPFEVLCYKNK